MFREKKYIFNEKTLSYEVYKKSFRQIALRTAGVVMTGLACFSVYFFLYTSVLGYMTPKEAKLLRENRLLLSRMETIDSRMDELDVSLEALQRRDNIVYRPIFGMDEIPVSVRNSGIGGPDRYEEFASFEHSGLLLASAAKMDVIFKKASVQSHSFDEVALLARRADDMTSCVPSICPVRLGSMRITSPFGYRVHPTSHSASFHEGIDFAGKRGDPVFATGDGVVEEVLRNYFGYGNMVVIDHGFGYKTRYAHLREAKVLAGQKVRRGDLIASVGNSGRSTGPHLHYEVIYRGRQINPWNFISSSMSAEEYAQITRRVPER